MTPLAKVFLSALSAVLHLFLNIIFSKHFLSLEILGCLSWMHFVCGQAGSLKKKKKKKTTTLNPIKAKRGPFRNPFSIQKTNCSNSLELVAHQAEGLKQNDSGF